MGVLVVVTGSAAVIGHLRVRDDMYNSVGGGLLTGLLVPATPARWKVVLLWGGLGAVGYQGAVFAGLDRLPAWRWQWFVDGLHHVGQRPLPPMLPRPTEPPVAPRTSIATSAKPPG